MKAVLFVGALAVGVGVVYWMTSKSKTPTIPRQFLPPDAPPQYPTALDAPLYSSPPASQTRDEQQNLPPAASSACNIQTRADWLGQGYALAAGASDEEFNEQLTGLKAQQGCFAPPT